jgi:putative FmdB family regulatory protein
MPTYAYRCPECGCGAEFNHSIDADFTAVCDCGTVMKRKYTPPAIQFKGSGFYSTSGGR